MSIKSEDIQFTKESIRNFKKMENYLLGSDLVLMLLLASPIKGKTKLQKQVFLVSKTFFKKKTLDPGFFPYKFGAYSKALEDSIDLLEKDGMIKVKLGSDPKIQYAITPKGKEAITRKINTMDISLDDLRKKQSDWNELTTKGIIRLVYRKYPEYATQTKVPDLKWPSQ